MHFMFQAGMREMHSWQSVAFLKYDSLLCSCALFAADVILTLVGILAVFHHSAAERSACTERDRAVAADGLK